MPIHHGFFGADDASQGISKQQENLGFCTKNEECLGCAPVDDDWAPVDELPWVSGQENADVFGILRDQNRCGCGVWLQKRLRTSWYL